jgi:DNA (cytosine-5)-methyltransferase 1
VVDRRSITEVSVKDIPEVDGFIGGPPCQSWSVAGASRGDGDPRGRLIWDYARLIGESRPKFFVLENVPGLISRPHRGSLVRLLGLLSGSGYDVSYGVLNAGRYGVPQSRDRVFIVGYRKDRNSFFSKPEEVPESQSIGGALEGLEFEKAVGVGHSDRGFLETDPVTANHYLKTEHFSYIYMSRNRVRPEDSFAFTVQASSDHAQLHPKAPPMKQIGQDQFIFSPGQEHLYRRISVRESARIQTFPDDFSLVYASIRDGYKMVGNAVPVKLAKAVGARILEDFAGVSLPFKTRRIYRGSIGRFDARHTPLPLFSA